MFILMSLIGNIYPWCTSRSVWILMPHKALIRKSSLPVVRTVVTGSPLLVMTSDPCQLLSQGRFSRWPSLMSKQEFFPRAQSFLPTQNPSSKRSLLCSSQSAAGGFASSVQWSAALAYCCPMEFALLMHHTLAPDPTNLSVCTCQQEAGCAFLSTFRTGKKLYAQFFCAALDPCLTLTPCISFPCYCIWYK